MVCFLIEEVLEGLVIAVFCDVDEGLEDTLLLLVCRVVNFALDAGVAAVLGSDVAFTLAVFKLAPFRSADCLDSEIVLEDDACDPDVDFNLRSDTVFGLDTDFKVEEPVGSDNAFGLGVFWSDSVFE